MLEARKARAPCTDKQLKRIRRAVNSLRCEPNHRPPPNWDPVEEIIQSAKYYLANRERDFPRYSIQKKTLRTITSWTKKAMINPQKYLAEGRSFLEKAPATLVRAGISLSDLESILSMLDYDDKGIQRELIKHNIKEIQRKLLDFSDAAEAELPKAPRDRREPDSYWQNMPRRLFILDLANVFEKLTGRRRGEGLANRPIKDDGDSSESGPWPVTCPGNEEPTDYETCQGHQSEKHFHACPSCQYRNLKPTPKIPDGKKPDNEFYGDFFNLVNVCLQPLDPEWEGKTNIARGREIQRYVYEVRRVSEGQDKPKKQTYSERGRSILTRHSPR